MAQRGQPIPRLNAPSTRGLDKEHQANAEDMRRRGELDTPYLVYSNHLEIVRGCFQGILAITFRNADLVVE